MKKNLLLLVWAILVAVPADAASASAYKAMCDTHLYEFYSGKGKREQIAEIAKGDTVYFTAETEAFIDEHRDDRLLYLPVEYKGRRGEINFSNYYPIRIESGDTLRYVHDSSLKNRTPIERFMVPQMEWAMNHSGGPASWLGWILAFTGVAIAGAVMMMKGLIPRVAPLVCGLAVSAVSACEIMYALSYHNTLLWFVYPSCVGGWGHSILNFLLLAVVIAVQCGGLYLVWYDALDRDPDEKAPKWISGGAFWPVALGVALLIMMWIDNGDMAASTYLIALGTMLVPALAGMAWMFFQKRFADGIVYPLLFLTGSLGLIMALMIMSMFIVLVVVGVAVLCVIVIAALSALSVLFGGDRVKVITNDGRTVTGTKNWDGTVSGDDGNKYHVK